MHTDLSTIIELTIGGILFLNIIRLRDDEDATFRNERRNAPPCCRCEYDLRGTPDRCPECGREIFGDECNG